MKSKLGVACAVLLAAMAAPAWALQLGEIEVKSALNQPLVAAIPLHPKNLAELDGLKVGLASGDDFARAGLTLTPTDRTLQFRVTTDNNGQKLVLVTSSEPVSDPYLDFLVRVDTREGSQLHEFVALLNPVIGAPAPVLQAAPVAGGEPAALPSPPAVPASAPPTQPAAATQPAASAPTEPAPAAVPEAQPRVVSVPAPQPRPAAQAPVPEAAEKPSPQVAPAPAPAAKPLRPAPSQKVGAQPSPQAAKAPASAAEPSEHAPAKASDRIAVQRGDTLSGLAQEARAGTGASLDQMMLALQAANPEAFFKGNINNLRAGAILRVPPRDAIEQRSIAEAAAAVRQQYESWQSSRPRAATVVEGAAAEAAASALPKPAAAQPTSDHLTLAAPTASANAGGRAPGGAAGGGRGTAAGAREQLRADHDTLVSLIQSNADLEARVHVLDDISTKTGKLLSLKDGTIAELQERLAAVQAAKPASPTPSAGGAETSATVRAAPPLAHAPWYARPLVWVVAGLLVVAILVLGLLGWRKRPQSEAPGYAPPSGDEDAATNFADAADAAPAPEARASDTGDTVDAEPQDAAGVAASTEPASAEAPEPRAPVADEKPAPDDDPYGLASLREPAEHAAEEAPAPESAAAPDQASEADAAQEPEAAASAPARPLPPIERVLIPPPSALLVAPVADAAVANEPSGEDEDAVDTKLDLARAYLDMGDPIGARAMIEEVLAEGSQIQKDAARRLLTEVVD